MWWINGYTSPLAQSLKLFQKPGKAYWSVCVDKAGHILKDWNSLFIHPNNSIFTPAKIRFEAGYNFAALNERKLRENIFISGNSLQLIAHGRGVAFAEGMAAYFYEEKGIIADLAIYINGTSLAVIPQSRRAVNCRIQMKTVGDWIGNKRNENLRHQNVIITEKQLKEGFCKYSCLLNDRNGESRTSSLFLRGNITPLNAHHPYLSRSYNLWAAIKHSIQLFNESSQGEHQHLPSQENISLLLKQYSSN